MANTRSNGIATRAIAGIIGHGRTEENCSRVELMLGPIHKETADTAATYAFARQKIWIGSVYRGPEQDVLWNRGRDICLLFRGECYGEKFRLAQILEDYQTRDLDFLQELNGWFSGVIVDTRRNRIILFNDRYGLGRLYYHESRSSFSFATEAKSLLPLQPDRSLDFKSVGEFISCGCVLQNRTLFSGIALIPPGSVWIFSPDHAPKKCSYFSPEVWEQQSILSGSDFYEQLKSIWERVLPRYLARDDRVALSLTGGLDSRMILAWAGFRKDPIPCFTFCGPYRECMDVKVARQVASVCGQPHSTIEIQKDFLDQFESLAEKAIYLSDGAMDVTGAVDLYLQHKARKIAPLRVTGTNGGELLRRLVAFKPKAIGGKLFQPEAAAFIDQAATTYENELQGHRLSFTAFKQAPWYLGGKFVVERSEVTLRMPYFDNDLVALAYRTPPELAESDLPATRLIVEGNRALRSVKTDRGSAPSSGLAARKFDRFWQQFTFKAEYAYDYGMPQWLAKFDRAFSPLALHSLFLGRHKIHHFRLHYRHELAKYVKEVLLDSQALDRPYLHAGNIQQMVHGHLRGTSNHTLEIHKLLTLELIQKELLRAVPAFALN